MTKPRVSTRWLAPAIVAALRAHEDQRAEDILERHVYNSYFGYMEEIGRSANDGG